MRTRTFTLVTTAAAPLVASLAAGTALASAPPKPLTSIKKTGPRAGTRRVIVTGALNGVQPDVAVYELDWTVATTNTGTLKLTPEEP